ncbi:MAG: hypothetical protein JO236_18385 [Mycobacterium sp.]|uniref:hypothetical protein n=1 Tax=Mycobacterium sp. TaxID=1785 RepID=UPI001EB13F54|nr:hypothetical protein [Mycobacterium sp.]MBW0019497.1 hypothetical protein [Mycobacterium sp.]
MATTDTAFTVPRHEFVPPASSDEIVLAPPLATLQTHQEATVLVTAAGLAYLPGGIGAAFAKGARQGGGLIGGLVAAGVSSAAKAASDRREANAAQPAAVPAAVQKALQRRNAFAAGYADVVSVRCKSTLLSQFMWIDAGGGSDKVKIDLRGIKAEQLAATIAVRRLLIEGSWILQEALASLRSQPIAGRPLAEQISDTDAVLDELRDLIEGADLTREEVAECALKRHPEFAEFESVPAMAELYSKLING